jgi:hypothetical protein
MITLTDLCEELNNFFTTKQYIGTVKIKDNAFYIDESEEALSDELQEGQYFRIVGSLFNDGVCQSIYQLKDETFEGAVWFMAVPSNVIGLLADINAWLEKYNEVMVSPYTSESFGGYSYNKGSNSSQSTWQSAFSKRLNKWRKIKL